MQASIRVAALLLGTMLPALATSLPTATRAETASPAPTTGEIVPTVTVAPARRSMVQQREPVSGSLVARQEVQIYPQVAGFEITEILAEIGDRVEAGQPLARLSDATLRAQLAQAEAEHARAGASISQAESQIESAEAAATQANSVLTRTRQLNQSGNTAQAALDEAVAAQIGAEADAASARDGLLVARANLAQADAALEIARLNLRRTTITAPLAGIVTERSAELGALSGGSAEPMFRVIANGEIELQGRILETALPGLKVGDPAEVVVAGLGQIAGKVRLIPASVDPVTRLGDIRISLQPRAGLRPGLFASGSVILDEREAITVPATAVLADGSGERVQVIRDGRVETRPVTAGVLWDGQREILDGLAPGEVVMQRAGAFFRDGDPVKPVTASEAEPAAPAPQGTAALGTTPASGG
ncbi:efflux RND transporter periplasmic adaptor subunit [Paracoccus sp. Z118]|uniref:efflux RND transporter periplasmic adaptor subunit n=1 Tax=Paracoccus sp. Z118 TaxID=2851017 RepID=UPI001C2C9BA1|nr:efflux RND transporter periplasmic adaptor subunit [Paracoccus sp. Z118]MBV0892208.1 efflux RND transporter periplasmic adaptor subunit [Paracoccus sp. Z118]